MEIKALLKTNQVFETCILRYEFSLNWEFQELKHYFDTYPSHVYEESYRPYVELFSEYLSEYEGSIDFVLYSYLLYRFHVHEVILLYRFFVSHLLRNQLLSFDDPWLSHEELKTKSKLEILESLASIINKKDTFLIMFLLCFTAFYH